MSNTGTPHYADLFTGKRPVPFRHSQWPDVMKPRPGVGYTTVVVGYDDLFAIKFYKGEKLLSALFEHALACVEERQDYSRNDDFQKRLTRVRFHDDGVHVMLLAERDILSTAVNA